MDWLQIVWLTLAGITGGVFGAIIGVGGGLLIVPILSLALGIPVHVAIASSLVAIIGTSCSSAVSYIKAGFTNIRLGIILETATVAGALCGALLAVWLDSRWLFGLFGGALIFAGYTMLRKRSGEERSPVAPSKQNNESSDGFLSSLGTPYYDPAAGSIVRYRILRMRRGLGFSLVAGAFSGLLGVGGGIVKVPVMNLMMGMPMKAAIGTSQLMIGITAAAGSLVFFQEGYVEPLTAAPVLVGTALGAQLGVRVMRRTPGQRLRTAFSVILFATAVVMILRAFGVWI